MGAGSAGCSATHPGSFPALPLPACVSLGTHNARSQLCTKPHHAESLETASKELRCSQSLRIPRDPGLLSLQVCGGRSSPDSFFAGGSWKVWLLELQATPSGAGAEASLTLALPWEGVHGRPPSLQHPFAHLRLTFSPRTELQPDLSGHTEASSQHPLQDYFYLGERMPFPGKVHSISELHPFESCGR